MCCVIGERGVPLEERGIVVEPGDRTRSAHDILAPPPTFAATAGATTTCLGVEGTASSDRDEMVVVGDGGVRMGDEWDDGAVDTVAVVGVPGRSGIGAMGGTMTVAVETEGSGLATVGGRVLLAIGGVATDGVTVGVMVDALDDDGRLGATSTTIHGGGLTPGPKLNAGASPGGGGLILLTLPTLDGPALVLSGVGEGGFGRIGWKAGSKLGGGLNVGGGPCERGKCTPMEVLAYCCCCPRGGEIMPG